MRFGVAVFPGSNCDSDTYYVLKDVVGVEVDYVWYTTTDLSPYAVLVLPGGFSYGDYLRPGAIAKVTPLVLALREFVEEGGLLLGICNGFQVLTEAGFLPGGLSVNSDLKFVCKKVHLRVERNDTPFTLLYEKGEVVEMWIAHREGRYVTGGEFLREKHVVFRYSSPKGQVSPEFCPNGSTDNVAGMVSESGRVLGMMPHPERSSEEILGSSDGLKLFYSVLKYLKES